MSEIAIENARSHNLAGASCRIPLGSLTVITGISGSGKSTLAFDTLYAEGQRRYVTSLSTYARQFLDRLPRPAVDRVSHLPPAIAIERRNRVTNARSTVGTATEILDGLRWLYAHAGRTVCTDCEAEVEPGTVEAVAGRILARFADARLRFGAPLPTRAKEKGGALRDRLLRDGYGRLLDGAGEIVEVESLPVKTLDGLRPDGLVLIDRLVARESEASRLTEAVAAAFAFGGVCVVQDDTGERHAYHEGFACDGCGRRFARPVAPLFSFNSPLGACEACQGFGRVAGIDPERVVPDPRKTLAQGAVAPFTTPGGAKWQARMLAAAQEHGVPMDLPFDELDPDDQAWVFEGSGRAFPGAMGFFARLERKRYKVQNRVLLARYRRYDPCPDCHGTRLCEEARCVRIGEDSIDAATRLTLSELAGWLDALELPDATNQRVARLCADLRRRVGTAIEVGLDYMTLDRTTRTLSGGEAQRIQLASALGGTLTASLYVLDEPSIGLHARDVDRLIGTLVRIRDQGNTVVVVEHSPEVIGAADHLIDIGPAAGRHGGRIVAEGSVDDVRRVEASLTGQALAGTLPRRERAPRKATGRLRIVGASENNLDDVTVDVPLGQLVAFTGVSGAGKSTLVRQVLVGQLLREPERGACTRVEGGEALDDVVVVDPAPPARSPRSNAATVSKAFEGIRARFAATREAKALGLTPGWFSFNVAGGRCEACEGAGEVVVDMQFLDDVRMPCEFCDGTRYRGEARKLEDRGKTIVDVLGFTVEEALDFYAEDRKIRDRLAPLAQVGLGYLTLGQPLSTLSGGEAQRLRLAQALREGAPRTLYVFDEPTTGLHPADIEVLLGCFDALLAQGASVLVVEHNLDVIRRADHVIDLGPEGGPGGGRVLGEGTPAEIARIAGSHTGTALKPLL